MSDELFQKLEEMCDTLKEAVHKASEHKSYMKKVQKMSEEFDAEFFKQFNKKIEKLKEQEERDMFVKASCASLLSCFFAIIEEGYKHGSVPSNFDEVILAQIKRRLEEIKSDG